MTNKAEDKFYFGKPGQPERFGYSYRPSNILAADLDYAISEIQKDMRHMTQVMQNVIKKNPLDAGWIWETDALHNNLLSFIDRVRGVLRHKDSQVQAKAKKAVGEVRAFLDKWEKMQARSRSGKAPFSSPGQPERFAESLQAKWDGKQYRVLTPNGAAWYSDDGKSWTLKHGEPVPASELRKYDIKVGTGFSRPGQPEKFDASSLDRGSFAEASQSPMLGKLLAAKVMPEGGWRAVQVGSDTLVISFEDADLARDSGGRGATKGYNATSPVQAIGRYWNVEVKNG
jgi:hypothetical protein